MQLSQLNEIENPISKADENQPVIFLCSEPARNQQDNLGCRRPVATILLIL